MNQSKVSQTSKEIHEIEKEGVEDILEKVDLSIVYEYQHVFEHVGKLHEFKRLYVERREVSEYEDKSKCISHNVKYKEGHNQQPQCDFEVMASRNLKSLSTEQFCSLLNGLLYSSIGYFYVEDSLQRGSLLYSDSTHVREN